MTSKQGESSPRVHDSSTEQGCQKASENVLVDKVVPSPGSTSMVYFPSPSSPGTEPPEKRHCRTGTQFVERNATARPSGGESSILCQAESAVLLGCDLPGLTKSSDTVVTPLPAEGFASMSDSRLLELLTKSDPISSRLVFPHVNDDIDSHYSNNEIGGLDDTVIVTEPMVSEKQGAPPPAEVSNLLSGRAPLIFHQEDSAVPLDGGLPAPDLLDSDNRGILTNSNVGNTLTEVNSSCISDWSVWLEKFLLDTTDADNTGVSAASSSNSVGMPYNTATLSAAAYDDNLVSPFLDSETQALASSVESELEVNAIPMGESNVMQQASTPLIPFSSLVSSSGTANGSCSETHGKAQRPITNLDVQGSTEAEENTVDRRIGEKHEPLPRRRLLIEKELTETDVGVSVAGIRLPKEGVTKYFDAIPEDSQGHVVTLHDAVTQNKTWIMRITTSQTVMSKSSDNLCRVYTLNDTFNYLKHHALDVGDWMQIFREESSNRYIVKFKRSSAEYNAPPRQRHLFGKTWKLIIRKMLTHNSSSVGLRARALALQKKKVEQHFPPVEKKAGVEIKFYDWDNERTWQMALKFTPSTRGRIYRLDGTIAFCKFYHLQKYDFVDIFKSDDLDASYAIRACKSDDRL